MKYNSNDTNFLLITYKPILNLSIYLSLYIYLHNNTNRAVFKRLFFDCVLLLTFFYVKHACTILKSKIAIVKKALGPGPRLCFMINEVLFHLSGCINSQNTGYWSTINPKEHLDFPLFDEKIVLFPADESQALFSLLIMKFR